MQKWWNWMLSFALLCLLFIAIPLWFDRGINEEMKPVFDKYIRNFNKNYKNTDEYEARFQHFLVSLQEIDRLNAESKGPHGFRARYGLTKLSDMSKTEYQEVHLADERVNKHPRLYGRSWSAFKDRDSRKRDESRNKDEQMPNESNVYYTSVSRMKRGALPLKVDWRERGVIGPIRNQGVCGACWAFSTIGAIEAMSAINTGKLEPLSVQEVIDCAGLGNSGCAGGDICLLLDWLSLTRSPIERDSEYPLRLVDGACQMRTNGSGVRIDAFTCDDFVGAEDKILEAIATHGPIAVAVNALTWQNYLGGVIQYHCSGLSTDLNHAVLLIGYDLAADVPYYIAKNSWGVDFGNSGYLKLAIGSNICGLANEVASVDVK